MCEAFNILLIGARGSGKTTVGRLLAARLDRPFVDLDDAVLDRFEASSVTEVWSTDGEPAWREAEAAALLATLEAVGQVVALGGGTPTVAVCDRLIDDERSTGRAWSVYLECPIETLAERLSDGEGDRPSLTGAGVVEELGEVVAARDATYRRLADFICDAGGTVEATVERLLASLRSRRPDADRHEA